MPIIHVNICKPVLPDIHIDPAKRFAELMDISSEHVTVHVSLNNAVYGNPYECIVHLHLPDLWKTEVREQMLNAIQTVVHEAWSIAPGEMIAMIHLIHAEQVIDRGKIEKW